MAHQGFDQRGRMLAVAVDEQHGAEPRVIEAGKQGGLLAEIARQRHHLNVERGRRQRAGDRERIVAAAVIDIDHLAGQRAVGAERSRDLDQPRMQARDRRRFVVQRHHDGKSLRGFCAALGRTPFARRRRRQTAQRARRGAVARRRCRCRLGRWINHWTFP